MSENELSAKEELLSKVSDIWDAYDRLSEDGRCDGVGGVEFRRVCGEWIYNLDESIGLDAFIIERANDFPDELLALAENHHVAIT